MFEPIKLIVRGPDRLIRRAAHLRAVFPTQHVAGFQNVGQGGRHVADFITRRLAVPFGDLLIRRGPRRLGYRKCGVQNISGAFGAICQAQQPVGTDPKRAGAFGNHLRIRQPCVAARQKLRNGRAINANRAGKFALID